MAHLKSFDCKAFPGLCTLITKCCSGCGLHRSSPYDWHFLRGTPYFARLAATGLLKPKYAILGSDAAGQLEAVA